MPRGRHRSASFAINAPASHLCLHHTDLLPCMEHRKSRDALSCDRCRAKKLRCSKDAPVCNSCAHSGFPCHYSGKVARSPLTRAYLTGVEKRLYGLEVLVSQLVPGVDVDDLLSSPNLPQVAGTTLPVINPRTPEAALSPQESAPYDSREPTLPEAVPNNAEGFNWQEENVTVDGLTDGMAALSVEPTGVGYLGQSLLSEEM
jgi:transcriptional regulatory protein GAL4